MYREENRAYRPLVFHQGLLSGQLISLTDTFGDDVVLAQNEEALVVQVMIYSEVGKKFMRPQRDALKVRRLE